MSRSFSYYWNEDEFVRNDAAIAAGERPTADYTGGSGFSARGLSGGDRLYLLNWYRGELWVLGRMDVAEVLDRQAALARQHDIYDAPEHVFAVPGTASPVVIDSMIHPDDIDELRFLAPDGSPVGPKRSSSGSIEPQTFRGLRELDPATAELLDDALGFSGAQRFDGAEVRRRCVFSVLFVDDDANEVSVAVEPDVIGGEVVERYVDLRRSVDEGALLDDNGWVVETAEDIIRRWAEQHDARVDEALLITQLGELLDEPGPPEVDATVELLGTAPLTYPPAGSLPGKKGSRTDAELTEVPDPESLTAVSRIAQSELLALVASVGGRHGLEPTPAIPIGSLDTLIPLLEEWVDHYGDHLPDGVAFSRPGLWHALDRLVPLQNPNRWDRLRKALTHELESKGWVRSGGPRGSKWWIPNRVV